MGHNDSSALPVIAGLVVGVGLIVVFAIIFAGSQLNRVPEGYNPYFHAQVSIDGLKDSYLVGNPIDFKITSKGHFPHICSDYYPLVKIENKDTGQIVWQNFQGAWGDNNLLLIICDPDPRYSEFTWHFGTNAERNEDANIVINQKGSYVLSIDLNPKVLQKQFTVR